MNIINPILIKSLHAGIILLCSMALMPLTLLKASDSYKITDGSYTSLKDGDTLACEPIDIRLVPMDHQHIINDTLIACIYDTITFQSGYSGEVSFKHHWFNGSSNPELSLFTTGVGSDIQKIWLDLIDLQTGCIYTDTLVVAFNFGSCVGENEMASERPLRFFPNPVRDILFVEYTGSRSPVQLTIYNISGQVVYQRSPGIDHPGTNQIQVDLRSQPRGMYVIYFIDGQNSYHEKIVLN
jgi:hypothetical protein